MNALEILAKFDLQLNKYSRYSYFLRDCKNKKIPIIQLRLWSDDKEWEARAVIYDTNGDCKYVTLCMDKSKKAVIETAKIRLAEYLAENDYKV
jgi:hypothetical protein